jgi:two-component system OmpR family sensor kinase/two-component system sensor histidine kinase BaeS
MKNSLWLKLMAAFIVVILIGGSIDAYFVSRVTQTQFSQYISSNGQAWAQSLAPGFGEYYAQNGSWSGVEVLLQNPWQTMSGNNMMWGMGNGGMMGDDMWGMGMDNGMMMDTWGMMGFRLLLADVKGVVVADSSNSALGFELKDSDLNAGVPVLVANNQVGTILPVLQDAEIASPANSFVQAINHTTWQAAGGAALIALVLGSLLFRQIVAPVKTLTHAAQRVAAGDLNQRIAVTSQDEIGQLAQAFNQMADSLDEGQTLRKNLIADVAHELRTPVSVLQGNLEGILDGVLPMNMEEIAALRDETALLSRLIGDLRVLSLAESGQLNLEKKLTDITSLISKSMETFKLEAEAKDISLILDFDKEMPKIHIDSDRIEQVIRNLVGNALRYTDSGGEVKVKVVKEMPDEISVLVQDTGAGISQEDLPYLFDRFYRADKSRNRTQGGSGIGLAIVKQLVEAHDGRISVESEGPNKGASFILSLPIMS